MLQARSIACAVCKLPFICKSKALCCSAECRKAARVKVQPKTGKCLACKKPFTYAASGRPQKYCSPKCQCQHFRRSRDTCARPTISQMPAQLVRANMSMLKEDIAQAKALARLEGRPFDHREFMRLNSPWQERYELAAEQ